MTSRPLAMIGSGLSGVAAIINALFDIAVSRPAGDDPLQMLVINTHASQSGADEPYPLFGIDPADLHPFTTPDPPEGFPTFGKFVQEMSKKDRSLEGALRSPTHGQVASYLEFMMQLAIIAAGSKVRIGANRQPIERIDHRDSSSLATIHYANGTELEVTPLYPGIYPRLGGNT